jgi:dTDP-4-amino-4,6-dideoxygalactose transaminase
MAYDINKILSEFGDNDFGFTAVDEAEYEAVIAEKDETVEEYKQRLQQLEKIIMPFLTNLYKSANQPYIHWPNRGPILETQMQKVLKLTRG